MFDRILLWCHLILGFCFLGRFLITASISVLVIGFIISISSRFSLGILNFSKSQHFSSPLKAGKTDVPAQCSQAGGVFTEKSDFLLHSGLQLIERGPLTLGRAICFIQSSYLNANLMQKHSHRLVQNNVWQNIWALCGPVRLTHKINHLRNVPGSILCWLPG